MFKPAKPIAFERKHSTNFRYPLQRRFRFCSGINLPPFNGSPPITTRVTYALKIISDRYLPLLLDNNELPNVIYPTNTHIRAYAHKSYPTDSISPFQLFIVCIFFFLWKPTLIWTKLILKLTITRFHIFRPKIQLRAIRVFYK